MDVGRVSQEPDGERPARRPGRVRLLEGLFQAPGHHVEVAGLQPALDPVAVHLDRDQDALVHGRGQGLGPAHAAQAGGEDEPAPQRASEVLARGLREGLVGPLEYPLAPDIDPGPGGHLPVHHQALAVELVEMFPGGPGRDQHRVRDEDARSFEPRAEDPHRLAGLHEQGLVVPQLLQAADDGVEALPVARGLADPAVDDQVSRPLRHLGVEGVHEHAQGGFLLPGAAGEGRPARGSDRPSLAGRAHIGHRCLFVESSAARS